MIPCFRFHLPFYSVQFYMFVRRFARWLRSRDRERNVRTSFLIFIRLVALFYFAETSLVYRERSTCGLAASWEFISDANELA